MSDDESYNEDILHSIDESMLNIEHGSFTLESMKKVVDYARPGIAFTAIQHAFPRVKDLKQLQRFREYVDREDNRFHKLQRIESFVVNKFRYA